MAKLLQRVEITLRSFYIFNSSFGQIEGEEHKKVLFYHPNDIELNTKIKDVGLSEAIIRFTGTFTSEDDCQALHTQKTTQLFYQPEPGYWLVLVLNVPKEVRLKDGVEVADYRGAEISDRIYRSILRQCYLMFRFQHGGFSSVGSNETNPDKRRELLCQELHKFYDHHLGNLKDPSQCDIIDMLHSIQYLPLDKSLFLRAQNFGTLGETFTDIKESIMLYQEQVLCGGKLNPEDLHSLHSYVVERVLKVEASNSSIAVSPSLKRSISESQVGGFVSTQNNGEGDGQEKDNLEDPLKVYVTLEKNTKPYYMLIYRALHITLCLFLDADQPSPKKELYDELHAYMAPHLTSLARDISSELTKEAAGATGQENSISNSESAPKYLFINEQSLQHHTNFQRHLPHGLPRNVLSIIADLANASGKGEIESAPSEEIQVKTTNDYWIVKRRCNYRQYYVILCNSKATLLDVTQEARRIFEQELTDDVFFDK
ncbi:vacuolar fusion protein CCZ1 homolog [Drosophila eugracilis]|uniref:vacuolar fusion protein CCZ1 homolog n=1 Tax=Drosophila eugracilis TaxID=29029 RepID=UPI0007E87253|nr:vacuolar fusion protein CCZ1 homolog [Drosophila eugracilis]